MNFSPLNTIHQITMPTDLIKKAVRSNIPEILRWAVIAALAGVVAFADQRWVSQESRKEDRMEFERRLAVVQDIPARVRAIETWMLDRKEAWQKNDAEHEKIRTGLQTVQSGLDVNRALLEAQSDTLKQLLQSLEQHRQDELRAVQRERESRLRAGKE